MSVIKANEIQDLNGNVILNTNNRIKFLQVVSGESTQQVLTNLTREYYDISTSVSLTTVGENSSFFISGYGATGTYTGQARCNLGFSVTNGSTTTRISGVDGVNGDSWGSDGGRLPPYFPGVILNRHTLWTPNTQLNSNVTLTFNLLGARYDAAPAGTPSGGTPDLTNQFWNLSPYGHNTTITVMEFAA